MPYINLLDTLKESAHQKIKYNNEFDLTKLKTSDVKRKRKTYHVYWETTLMLIDKNDDESKYNTIIFDAYQGFIAVELTTNQLIRQSVPKNCAINQIIKIYANLHEHFEYLPFLVGQNIFFPLPKKNKNNHNQTWISNKQINNEYIYPSINQKTEIYFKSYTYYFIINVSENYIQQRLKCCYQILKMMQIVKTNFSNLTDETFIHTKNECYSFNEALEKCMDINEEKVIKRLINKYPNEKLNQDLLNAYKLDKKTKTSSNF